MINIYICICTYISVFICIYIYVCVYIYLCIHMCMYLYIGIYVNIHQYICIYIFIYVHCNTMKHTATDAYFEHWPLSFLFLDSFFLFDQNANKAISQFDEVQQRSAALLNSGLQGEFYIPMWVMTLAFMRHTYPYV